MRTIGRGAVFCTMGLLGFAPTAHGQIVLGVQVVEGGEPSEIVGAVGISSYRHLVAVEYSKLREKDRGSGCSMGARYEFTPRKVYDQTADRVRRISVFAVGSVGHVGDSCASDSSNEEKPATGLGRYFNARADVGGGARIRLFEVPGGFGGLLRVALTSRHFFGTEGIPGRTVLGLSVGFDLLTTVFLGKGD